MKINIFYICFAQPGGATRLPGQTAKWKPGATCTVPADPLFSAERPCFFVFVFRSFVFVPLIIVFFPCLFFVLCVSIRLRFVFDVLLIPRRNCIRRLMFLSLLCCFSFLSVFLSCVNIFWGGIVGLTYIFP